MNWILDADIRDFFTGLDHRWLGKFLEHPVHPLALDTDRQRIECVVGLAPWPEPVREAGEVLLSR